MADSRIFRVSPGITAEIIGKEVEDFLREEKELTVEGFFSEEGYFIQAKESSTWKKFTGLGKALQVQIVQSSGSEIIVNIGMGEWADKVGAAAVGMIFFTPLAITAAIGAYGQNKLPSEIFECIEKFIVYNSQNVRRSSSAARCQNCGASIPEDKKYCPYCGASVSFKKTLHCRNCGAVIEAGKKFCGDCGTPVD